MKNIVSIFIFYIGFQFSMVAQSTCVSIGFQSKTETTATFSCTLTDNGSPAAAVADYTIILSANGASLDARSGSSTVSMPSSLGSFTVPITSGATTVSFSLTTGEVTSTTNVIPVSLCNSTISIAVLPVELLTFTGYNKGGVNILTWETASEVNNKGFQVERLNAQGNVWDILGFKAANHKTGTYDFTDNTPLSTSYYRLRQLDNDGKETYSKVISIASKGSDKLKVYPNPVSDVLTVDYTEGGNYQIINLLGQQVLNVLNTRGAQRIDVSALPQGTYFLKVGAEQVKFIKY